MKISVLPERKENEFMSKVSVCHFGIVYIYLNIHQAQGELYINVWVQVFLSN